jgi:hypothetical protein
VLNTYGAGVGMGYKVNNWFRTDLILDYRSQIHTIGSGGMNCFINVSNPTPVQPNPQPETCTGHFDSEIRRWDLLANPGMASRPTSAPAQALPGRAPINPSISHSMVCLAKQAADLQTAATSSLLPISIAANRA